MDSILDSIKDMVLGYSGDDSFDTTLIMLINSALSTLTQIGVGPEEGYSITDKNNTWDEFVGTDPKVLPLVKEYIFANVKLGFDTPASSNVAEQYQKMIAQSEWRLNIECDKTWGK